jgi:hypothetical protein
MKKIKLLFAIASLLICTAVVSSCTLFGLKKQTDFNRITNVDTIDIHLYKTAWAYLKARSYATNVAKDTIFRRMYDAIIYSGIDTNEYIKPGRTFIFINNNSVKALFASVFTSANVAGKKWQNYSAADVKTYLQYLIVTGTYSHYNLPLTDVSVKTLAPAGAYTNNPAGFKFSAPAIPIYVSNPNSTMNLRVLDSSNGNTSDYPLVLNGGTNYVYTSDLMPTNGVIQVMNTIVTPVINP